MKKSIANKKSHVSEFFRADDFIEREHQFQKKRLSRLYYNIGKKAQNVIPLEKKLVILIDIVGFSKRETYEQWSDIMILQHYLREQSFKNKIMRQITVSQFVPTGDGCYILANECSPEVAVQFAFSIIQGFQKVQPNDEFSLSLRASALIGEVVPFFDVARHKNYIGEGMNEASRILSGGQASVENEFKKNQLETTGKEPGRESVKNYSRNLLLLGDSLAEYAASYKDQCSKISYFSNVADKHGKVRNITALQGIKP